MFTNTNLPLGVALAAPLVDFPLGVALADLFPCPNLGWMLHATPFSGQSVRVEHGREVTVVVVVFSLFNLNSR